MVPLPRRFDERAMLYIGLPTLFVFLVTIGLFLVYNHLFTIPRWGYFATGAFLVLVLAGATAAAVVWYLVEWVREAPP